MLIWDQTFRNPSITVGVLVYLFTYPALFFCLPVLCWENYRNLCCPN